MDSSPSHHDMPASAYSHLTGIDEAIAQRMYDEAVDRLNKHTPTAEGATEILLKSGITPDLWEGELFEGAQEDTMHERRALILVARGAREPMGELYHRLRAEADVVIDGLIANRARNAADNYDPAKRLKRRTRRW
jgi:hypothetical protein